MASWARVSRPARLPGVHLGGGEAEDEDVLGADMLAHFDIGAVERADGQRAIERELHVAGAGRFHAGCRDLLGQVGGGDDGFGEGHVVVRQEGDLEQAADGWVVVDDAADIVGELDDLLGAQVACGGFAREDFHPRDVVLGRVGADVAVGGDDLQDVEQLAFVFVDALDLDVEHGVGVGGEVELAADEGGERDLLGTALVAEPGPEGGVVGVGDEGFESHRVGQGFGGRSCRRAGG